MSELLQVMDGVREYVEEDPVELHLEDNGRLSVLASNEGGQNATAIDLLDLIEWVKMNKPEILHV